MPDINLLNMDCMDYMRSLPDNAFKLAIVDPPYGLSEHGGKSRTKAVLQKDGSRLVVRDGGYKKKEWDKIPPSADYFSELSRVSRNQIIWGANYYAGMRAAGAIIWDKVNDSSDQSDAEIALNTLNNRVDIVRYMWRGMMQGESIHHGTRQQGNKKLNEKRIHPTQKPVKLYEWLLSNYAKPGDRILDTHLGSGSSAIAAHYAGHDFVGIELDPDYYAAAKKRFEENTKQIDIFSEAS